jgi:hypothetical protein
MSPRIALLVITDGRRTCLQRTLDAFDESTAPGHIADRVVVNDCAEGPAFTDWVDTLGFDLHVRPEPRRRGYAGAINAGWVAVRSLQPEFIFHLEDDFIATRYLDLRAMATITADRSLAQMALRRQPWNEVEAAAGGVVEVHPEAYVDCSDGQHGWLEHRMFFTTNPSLYPIAMTDSPWPDKAASEGHFSHRIFEDPSVRCAYWGTRYDPPWVIHIGAERIGTGY